MIFSTADRKPTRSPSATLLETGDDGQLAGVAEPVHKFSLGDPGPKVDEGYALSPASSAEDATDLQPEDPNDLNSALDSLADELDLFSTGNESSTRYSAGGARGFAWGAPGISRGERRSPTSGFSGGGFLGAGGGFGGFPFDTGEQEPASIFEGIVASGLMRGEVDSADIGGVLSPLGADDGSPLGICAEGSLSVSPCTSGDFDPSELLASLSQPTDSCDVYAGGLTLSPCNYGSPTPDLTPPVPTQPRLVNIPRGNPGPNDPPPGGGPGPGPGPGDNDDDPPPPGDPDPEPMSDPHPPEHYAEVPAPASILLLSVGLLMLRRRV
ncbi:MAG: hypothetical protein AAF749_01960 [Pseudomonadota bacterium]